MPRGLWEDEFYMTQSILLVIIVIGTIALITCRSGVGILLGEVNIYDKEMTECYRGVAIILIVVCSIVQVSWELIFLLLLEA